MGGSLIRTQARRNRPINNALWIAGNRIRLRLGTTNAQNGKKGCDQHESNAASERGSEDAGDVHTPSKAIHAAPHRAMMTK